MLNAHGNIRDDNLTERIADTERWKPHRLELSLVVQRLIRDLNWCGFIDGGTLLGAWRNGKMIVHDDDFDYAVLRTDLLPVQCDSALQRLYQHAAAWLASYSSHAECRIVSTYAKKLEIYYPEFGRYDFRDTNYHNVSCDLQLYVQHPEIPDCYQQQHSASRHLPIPHSCVLPLGTAVYEGNTYATPGDTETFLRSLYGYLGEDAVYNANTGLYEPRQ